MIAADTRRRRGYSQVPHPGPGAISFAGGMPDSRLFPTDAFRRVLNRVIREEGRELLQYYPARGYPPLREFLSGYLLRFGLEARPEEILIVNGSQQGFDLVARTLLDPGDFVAIEEPSYPRAMQVFRAFGAQLLPVPMVDGGLDPEHLDRLLERQSPKLLYCQPSAHNPTGLTMRDDARKRLLEVAARHRLPIMEDGFDGSLFFGPRPPAPLKAARRLGAGHLRRHLLEDPLPGLAARLDRGRAGADRAAGGGQGAGRHPHQPAHPGRGLPLLPPAPARPPPGAGAARVRSPARRAARPLAKRMPPGRDVDRARGRLLAAGHVARAAWTRRSCSSGPPREESSSRPGNAFFVDGGGERMLRLSFSALPLAQIDEGIRRLAEIIRDVQRQPEPASAAALPGVPLV